VYHLAEVSEKGRDIEEGIIRDHTENNVIPLKRPFVSSSSFNQCNVTFIVGETGGRKKKLGAALVVPGESVDVDKIS